MQNDYHSLLTQMIGKRVLVFDTETTGLPPKLYGRLADPKDYQKYNNCRLLQIAWYYTESFDINNIDFADIQCHLRKPIDFNQEIFDPDAVTKNGLTYDVVREKGITFPNIINLHLGKCLKNCDYIVAHNIEFDINILLAEFYRRNTESYINTINGIKLIDTMKIGTEICKIPLTYGGYKYASQVELYRHLYGDEPPDQHDAGGDVKALLMCLMKMMSK